MFLWFQSWDSKHDYANSDTIRIVNNTENRMSSGISKKNFRGRQHVKHTKFALLNNSVVV